MIPFRLTFRPGVSLYEQVVYAARKAIVAGQLRPGDPFPSVRTLSKELKINPNTAHKVILYLTNEGLVEIREFLTAVRISSNGVSRDERQFALAPLMPGRKPTCHS